MPMSVIINAPLTLTSQSTLLIGAGSLSGIAASSIDSQRNYGVCIYRTAANTSPVLFDLSGTAATEWNQSGLVIAVPGSLLKTMQLSGSGGASLLLGPISEDD